MTQWLTERAANPVEFGRAVAAKREPEPQPAKQAPPAATPAKAIPYRPPSTQRRQPEPDWYDDGEPVSPERMRRKLLLVKKQMNYGSYRDMKEARRKPKPAYRG